MLLLVNLIVRTGRKVGIGTGMLRSDDIAEVVEDVGSCANVSGRSQRNKRIG